MAIMITDGTSFLRYSEKGGAKFTEDINEAEIFKSISDAIHGMRKAPVKTKNYYVWDSFKNHVCWKWYTKEEQIQMLESRNNKASIKRDANGKIKRKHYGKSTREMLYKQADGCCQLCGRKMLLQDVSIDHRTPLAMGGVDEVENLQIAHVECNRLKSDFLPEAFLDRISEIFIYQMDKKYHDKVVWKIARYFLNKIK